jgi:hypothetical protein
MLMYMKSDIGIGTWSYHGVNILFPIKKYVKKNLCQVPFKCDMTNQKPCSCELICNFHFVRYPLPPRTKQHAHIVHYYNTILTNPFMMQSRTIKGVMTHNISSIGPMSHHTSSGWITMLIRSSIFLSSDMLKRFHQEYYIGQVRCTTLF